MRTLLVYEFPPGDHEWQLRDLAEGLRRYDPGGEIRFCVGFLPRYRPGGLRPSRIINGMWIHARACLMILLGRFDFVVVRSAPPLIQLTTSVACRLRGVRYGIWLMDAHPELEDVMWGGVPVLRQAIRLLVRANGRCLAHATFVVVLDEAMRRRLIPDHTPDRVIICPTWGLARPKQLHPSAIPAKPSPALRFVYLGNLGEAHDVPAMCRLLAACATRGGVTLTFFGTSAASVEGVARALTGAGVRIESHPGIPYEELDQKLPALGFDFGLVSLNHVFAGLLSPSKYIGYLVAAVPVVYMGPAGSNAADVCVRFGAGVSVSESDLSDDRLDQLVERLRAGVSQGRLRRNTEAALNYFDRLDGAYLASRIAPRIRP